MTDTKPVCVECTLSKKKVTRYICKENGVTVPYGFGSGIRGDMYQCPGCGKRIVIGFGYPLYLVPPDVVKETLDDGIFKGCVDSG